MVLAMPSVSIAHDLPRDEVRRRMTARADDLHKLIPGGIGQVQHQWEGEDRMAFTVTAMGQSIRSTATIEERALVIDFTLPPALTMMRPMVEGVIRQAGDKLLLGKG